jgi:ADP-dependent NAD(P)H-hydrate dehydratase / NAD(P)H-hydrate epimerase
MTEPLPRRMRAQSRSSAKHRELELAKGKSVVAIGPGISREAETSALVRALVAELRLPMVVDADGLNAFEGRSDELNGKGRALVITPHPGEMARLLGCSIA